MALEGLSNVEIEVVLIAVLVTDRVLNKAVERVLVVLVRGGVVLAFIGHLLTAFSNKF